MRIRPAAVVFLAAALSAALASAAHAQADVDVSLSAHFSRGDYGGRGDIDIVYVPLITKLETGAWTFKAILPWLRISGGSTLVEGPAGPIVTPNETTEGLGDIVVEGAYSFSPKWRYAPFVQPGLRLKLPTADAGDGLGTGELDVTPDLEISRTYGRVTPFVEVGYRVLGDPRRISYEDGFVAAAGFTFRLLSSVEPGLFAYWKQSASDRRDDSAELLPILRWRPSSRWIADAYASFGFTDSSPDYGVGLQIHYVWHLAKD